MSRFSPKRLMRVPYRLLRASFPPPISDPLLPELVKDCRFCASRLDLLDRLPRNGVVAELGTQAGHFAREIVSRTEPRELHLIDRDFASFDPSGLLSERVHRHEGDTANTIAGFPPSYFDWVYIDADHSFQGVTRDIEAASSRVKPGGLLIFNDFAHIDPYLGRYGVHRAVTGFANRARWQLRYFAYEVAGLYDVAIERPLSTGTP